MSGLWNTAKNIVTLKGCRSCGSFQRDCGFLCGTCWRGAELFVWNKNPPELPQLPNLLISPLFQWNPEESDHLSDLILAHKGSNQQSEWMWAATRWLEHHYTLGQSSKSTSSGHRSPRRHIEKKTDVFLQSAKPRELTFIPAPSTTGRHHAHEFAEGFAQALGGKVLDVLRMKSTIKQRGLSRFERSARSIETVEQFTAEDLKSSLVILIDDVVTTGQTAEACRQVLGLAEVEVWCLAYRSRLAASS